MFQKQALTSLTGNMYQTQELTSLTENMYQTQELTSLTGNMYQTQELASLPGGMFHKQVLIGRRYFANASRRRSMSIVPLCADGSGSVPALEHTSRQAYARLRWNIHPTLYKIHRQYEIHITILTVPDHARRF